MKKPAPAHTSSASTAPKGGFTLIELAVVLTIVAVLAAIALPRYSNLQRDARIGHLQNARGAVASAATTVHAAMLARRGLPDPWPCPAGGTVADNQLVGVGTACTEAGIVHTMNGYPGATAVGTSGIVSVAKLASAFNPSAAELAASGYVVSVSNGTATFSRGDAPKPAACSFSYIEPSASWSTASFSSVVVSGC